jgi:hypothetical protein
MSVVITSVALEESFKYHFKGDSETITHHLVPTVIEAQVKGLEAKARLLAIHPNSLPFGFVEGVSLHGAGLPDFRVHVMKSTGQRVTPRTGGAGGAKQRRVSLVSGTMNTDQDAAHTDFAKIKERTGHDLRFRLLPGELVVSLAIEFYGAPPAEFVIRYHGANAISKHVKSNEVSKRLASRAPVSFLFPPITATTRMRLASQKAHELAGTAADGEGAGAGAEGGGGQPPITDKHADVEAGSAGASEHKGPE